MRVRKIIIERIGATGTMNLKNTKRVLSAFLAMGLTATALSPLTLANAAENKIPTNTGVVITGGQSYNAAGGFPEYDFGPDKAFDGLNEEANRWAANGADQGWLQLDWEQAVTFNRVKLYETAGAEMGNRLTDVTLYVSEDGAVWNEVKKITGLQNNGTDLEVMDLDAPVTTKHAKLVTNVSHKEINLNEVEFVLDVPGARETLKKKLDIAKNIDLRDKKSQAVQTFSEAVKQAWMAYQANGDEAAQRAAAEALQAAIDTLNTQTLGENLALNVKVTASSEYAENEIINPDYAAAKAVDGDFATRWATMSTSGPFEIVLDLGSPKQFNQVVICENTEFPGRLGSVRVQVSDDNQNWTDWHASPANPPCISSLVGNQVTKQYIKVILTDRNIDKGQNIDEIGVYNDPQAVSMQYSKTYSTPIRPIDPNWVRPTPADKANVYQLRKQAMKYGMFIHFGVNTFTNREWGQGTESPTVFQPDPATYDPEQWVRNAWESGMNYIVLITKHHDGFALFDTKYGEHSVAHNGNPENNFDVVARTAEACKKYGIKLGLYYSIWDMHWDKTHPLSNYVDQAARDQDYADFAYGQIEELMTKYGEICELWIDGGWQKSAERWEYDRIYDMVKRNQPNCQMSVNLTIGKKPVKDHQNGDKIVNFPSDFRLYDGEDTGSGEDAKLYTYEGKTYYLPFEGTFRIGNGWFGRPDGIVSADHPEMSDMSYLQGQDIADWYTKYVRQQNTLVMNVPPLMDGLQKKSETNRLNDAARILGIAHGAARNNIPEGANCKVIVHHLTTDGYVAGPNDDFYGKPGESYTTAPLANAGELAYILTTTPKNAQGTFTEASAQTPIEVTYVYTDAMRYDLADYSALNEALASAAEKQQDDYTAHSWKALTDAVAAAEAISKGLTAEKQAEVNAAAAAVNDAISKLTGNSLSANLSLAGDIGMNFLFELNEKTLKDETAKLAVAVDGKTVQEQLVRDAEKIEDTKSGKTFYKISTGVAARQMADAITVTLTAAGQQPITREVSVRDYSERILNDANQQEPIKQLVRTMLYYGGWTQKYKNHHVTDLADQNLDRAALDAMANNVTAESLNEFRAVMKNMPEGVQLRGVNLSLTTTTTLRFALGGDLANCTFKVEDQPVQAVQNGEYTCIEVPNILPQKLDHKYQIAVTKNGQTGIIEYSPMSYVRTVLNKPDAFDEALVGTAKALRMYNQAADALFAPKA